MDELETYAKTYNLDDLNPNDLATLEALLTSIRRKKELDRKIDDLFQEELNDNILYQIKTLQDLSSKLTPEISNLQETLKISRKSRGEKEQDVREYIERLKTEARKYANNKFQWIFCPSCKRLIATIWWIDQDGEQTVEITCPHKLKDTICGTKIRITSKELKASGGRNLKEIPETLK